MPFSLAGPNHMPTLPAAFNDQEAHDQLLSDWLEWNDHFPALAAKHGLTIDQLMDWYSSDIIQTRLRRMSEMAEARAQLLAKLHSAAALTRLAEIVEDTRAADPKDRIRAATQILRRAADLAPKSPRESKAQLGEVGACERPAPQNKPPDPAPAQRATPTPEPAPRPARSSPPLLVHSPDPALNGHAPRRRAG